ncbi:MAG: hypothetical protein ABIA63_13870 [bacterium]
MLKQVSYILIPFLLLSVLCAATQYGPKYTNLRYLGMGNARLALVDDGTAVFFNPAGLNNYYDHLTLYGEPVRFVFGPSFFKGANFLVKHVGKLSDPTKPTNEYYNDFAAIDGLWTTFGYIPEFRCNTRNMGVGLNINFQPQIALESGLYSPKVGIGVTNDVVLAAGAANRFGRRWSIGLNTKFIYRIIKKAEFLDVTDAIVFGRTLEKQSALTAINKFAEIKRGIGFDFGAIYHAGLTKYALVLQDFPTFLQGTLVHPGLNVGVAHHVGSLQLNPKLNKFLEDCIFAFDIHDFFGSGSFLKKIHMGGEIKIANLDIQGGFNQGYPTFGMTLKWWIFKAFYVNFTEERGQYVGELPFPAHVIGASMDISL